MARFSTLNVEFSHTVEFDDSDPISKIARFRRSRRGTTRGYSLIMQTNAETARLIFNDAHSSSSICIPLTYVAVKLCRTNEERSWFDTDCYKAQVRLDWCYV